MIENIYTSYKAMVLVTRATKTHVPHHPSKSKMPSIHLQTINSLIYACHHHPLPLYAFQGEEQTYIGQEQYDEGNELKFNYFKKFDYSFNSCFFLRRDFTHLANFITSPINRTSFDSLFVEPQTYNIPTFKFSLLRFHFYYYLYISKTSFLLFFFVI